MFSIIATYHKYNLLQNPKTKKNRYRNFPRPQLFPYMSDDDDMSDPTQFHLIWE